MGFSYRGSAVSRAVVHDHGFPPREGLADHAPQCLIQRVSRVVGGHDDRYDRIAVAVVAHHQGTAGTERT